MYLPSYLPHQVKCVEEASISVALVFKNIQFETMLNYLKEDPLLKSWLLKPLPIMGDTQSEVLKDKLTEFTNQLMSRISSFDREAMIDDLIQELDKYHQT